MLSDAEWRGGKNHLAADIQMLILALHALGHDTGLALFRDDELVFAIETERLSRRKHDSDIQIALSYFAELFKSEIPRIDLVVTTTNLNIGLLEIANGIQVQEYIERGNSYFDTSCTLFGREIPCFVVAHEVAHATLALHFANWKHNTLVYVNEGHGTFSRNAIYHFKEGKLSLIAFDTLPWYGSGFGWSGISSLVGLGRSPSAAGRTMALAAYADPKHDLTSILLEQPEDLHHASISQKLSAGQAISEATRRVVGDVGQANAALAAALQGLFTEAVVNDVTNFASQIGTTSVALGGGCALNLPTNTALRRIFPTLAIPPACNDSGQALGAGLFAVKFKLGLEPKQFSAQVNGVGEEDGLILNMLRGFGLQVRDFDPIRIAQSLARGGVLAFVDRVSAIGPRSLGERSLIADPTAVGMRERVSSRLKKREWFRPLAPVVTEREFQKHFPGEPSSPNMLFQYAGARDLFPEATHRDGTSRIQTLQDGANPRLTSILNEFQALTGVSGLINTSLNGSGKSIAYGCADVLDDFRLGEIDGYVFGRHLVLG